MRRIDVRKVDVNEWEIPRTGEMRVPGRLYATERMVAELIEETETPSAWSALAQLCSVAALPGIQGTAIALPDVHPGYGFPIGGVAAFDLSDGVVVVGGVGFDINCGVRLLSTPLSRKDVAGQVKLADRLFEKIPAGLGSRGRLRLRIEEIDQLLSDGACFVVGRGFGTASDLEFTESHGRLPGADPAAVSLRAKQRQFQQVGTLGSGNHYVELQVVESLLDPEAAKAYGLEREQIVVAIHSGSRALGHQIGQDSLREMEEAASRFGLPILDKELACAPIGSPEGRRYLAAIACGANCAFANRQVIADLVRQALCDHYTMRRSEIRTVYDIGHNFARIENHVIDGVGKKDVLVHRKGSTRAFGPDAPDVPSAYREVGHPTIVGGTMGTASYVMRATEKGIERTIASGIHGAGRRLSRKKAAKRFWGEKTQQDLEGLGILVRGHSARGLAEEAPLAYKDIDEVVSASIDAGITRPVARLRPLIVIKG
ncbi:RtcB family protein [Candidatus Bipolaricaulota bacterium]|nr:RtcB family protein [Candidatus Bipolaricaulota bacterium]